MPPYRCPHCAAPIAIATALSSGPAFPKACKSCAGLFHASGTVIAILVACPALALVFILIVTNAPWWQFAIAVLAVSAAFLGLARRARILASTRREIRVWRGLLVLGLFAVAIIELWPLGLGQHGI